MPILGRPHRWSVAASVGAAVCMAGGLGLLAYVPGTPVNDFLVRYEGYSLYVIDPVHSVSVERPGEEADVVVHLRNVTDRAVTIYGIKAECGCIRAERLPLTVGPRASREIHFRMVTRGLAPGTRISHVVRLYVDVPSPPVLLTINVQVSPAAVAPTGIRTRRTRVQS